MKSGAIHSILEAVGDTAVIPLRQFSPKGGATIYGKYEACNPTSSIKDRIALAMVEKGESAGLIHSNTTILAATSGNTGVALALVCAVKAYRLILFMPETASLEKRRMFEGFGAHLELTPKHEGVSGAVHRSQQAFRENPNCYLIDQFSDEANVVAHQRHTAQEILADFPDGVDALVLGVGTGGSITGVGGVLKKKFPHCQIIAVEPEASAVLSGRKSGLHQIQQLGLGFVPKILQRDLIDEIICVPDAVAIETTRLLARQGGFLVGLSSGANVWAAGQVAQALGTHQKVLTFLSDAGQRYFSGGYL